MGTTYVLADLIAWAIGGNLGVLLLIPLHFLLMPLLSIALIVTIVRDALISRRPIMHRLGGLTAIIVPICIIVIAAVGELGIVRMLPAM